MKKLNAKSDELRVRVTKKEKNKIRGLAKIYAGGNLSQWVRHCIDNYESKFLTDGAKEKMVNR